MNREDKIKELEETIKKAQEQIQELKAMENSKVWKPKENREYWYITEEGVVDTGVWEDFECEKRMYAIGNCFKTEKEAEEAIEIKKIDTELRRYAIEHNEKDIDWTNINKRKYYIYFDTNKKILDIGVVITLKEHRGIYFTSKEIALAAIEAIGKDRVEKWAKA